MLINKIKSIISSSVSHWGVLEISMHGLSGAVLGDLLEFLVMKHVVGIFSKKNNPDVFK